MLSIRETVRKGTLALLDLVYPESCALCEKWTAPEEERGLCASCESRILENVPPFCPTCGSPYQKTEAAPCCGSCDGKEFSYDRLWYTAPYEGVLREALHKLKYEGRKPVAGVLAKRLTFFAKQHLQEVRFHAVVPVPLTWQKERERQFNQAALLAKPLAQSFGVALSCGNLLRIRATLPQVELSKPRRFENVRGAFRARHPSYYRGKNLLLVDDVVTTGATVSACAKTLREAGAEHLYVLTLAGGRQT
ncbi:MAG: ComF family protein [Candidatus Omnitrophota bacterium]